MKTQTTHEPPAAVAATPLARLGASHGYRLDGDTVYLNASFVSADAARADAGRAWSLRLVAATEVPASAEAILAAHVVTEIPLPPLSELTGAVENYEVAAGALAPSGKREYHIALALLARDAAGEVAVHDFFAYARPEAFLQPRLVGAVGCWFESDTELVLDVDHIVNPRAADNLSGTLSVEVWALATPYSGGAFDGTPVAGAILGSLTGNDGWHVGALHLNAIRPAADARHLVVMLREWNGAAYATRDHVSFAIPAPVAAAPAETATTPAAETKDVAAIEASVTATEAAETAASAVEAEDGTATDETPAKEAAVASAPAPAAPAKPATAAKAEKPAAKAAPKAAAKAPAKPATKSAPAKLAKRSGK